MENEIWERIENYDDYEVSNFGNVKSFKGNKSKILKPFRRGELKKKDKGYYMAVKLANNDGHRDFAVHRLVASAFIPNPEKFTQVNHKNGMKDDNRLDNLEWCSASYNVWHSYNILGNTFGVTISVNQYTKNGDFVANYESITEACNITGINMGTIIASCKKHRKSAGGFLWRYIGDESDLNFTDDRNRPVLMISKYGEVIERFETATEAALKIGKTSSNIIGCCIGRHAYKYVGGYMWRYEDGFTDEYSKYKDSVFIMMSLQNLFEKEFNGIKELIDNTGYDLINIIKCCKGERIMANNHKWSIKGEEMNIPRTTNREKAVIQYSLNGDFIKEWDSIQDAKRFFNLKGCGINNCCKGRDNYNSAAGYKWKYKEDVKGMINN